MMKFIDGSWLQSSSFVTLFEKLPLLASNRKRWLPVEAGAFAETLPSQSLVARENRLERQTH
jgi:hypothetical protein